MKRLVLFFGILFTIQAFAVEVTAIVRNKRFRAKETKVELKDLISSTHFDGEYFKIVKGVNNDAIALDDKELSLKAATVYYHLTKAREYYVNELKSEYVKSLPKMTVRLDITRVFNELGHYGNVNLPKEFNNALSVPAGEGLPGRDIEPWGLEIWFRPSKKINIKDLNLKDTSIREFSGVLRAFRQQTHMQSLTRFLVGLANSNKVPMFPGGVTFDSVFRLVGASVIMEVGYQSIDVLNRIFRRKNYKLETALVPEIIYHEYSHVALSDHLELSHSTPVNEGMADYFAGTIANSSKLATKIKKYNTFSGKKSKNKKLYQLQFETNLYANTDFVFGLLWELKKILGSKDANKFLYILRSKIDTNSTIRDQLIEGILDTCKEACSNPSVDRLKILKSLNSRGI